MKVSERTINLLKNYANINQSIEFYEGKTLKTVSPLNTILTSVEIEEEFPAVTVPEAGLKTGGSEASASIFAS